MKDIGKVNNCAEAQKKVNAQTIILKDCKSVNHKFYQAGQLDQPTAPACGWSVSLLSIHHLAEIMFCVF